jgi:plasmid stabilization system protein ParE
MYRLDVSGNAEQDFDRIIAYITEKLVAPVAAADFADAVYDCYDSLENNPYIYERCRDAKLNKEGYRRAVIKNYVLVYRISEEAKMVVAHRFFYGRQDYADLI